MSCHARELVAHRALPGHGARRGRVLVVPWMAFPASSSCRGLVLRAAVPASSSCQGLALFGWPSRPAPLARGSLSSGGLPGKLLLPGPWLKYFDLEWPKRGPWRVLAIAWQALPRGATTARAQVRGTKV